MLREITHMLGEKPDDPIGILIMSSMFRDDLPWLYELGAGTYRAVRDMHPDARNTLQRFRRAIKFMRKGPFPMEEFGFDPRMMDIAFHELERYLGRSPEAEDNDEDSNENTKQQ
jgi:hypothetical protein